MSDTPESLTDPLIGSLVSVPRVGAGVCDVCHSQPNAGDSRCGSCRDVFSQLSRPTPLVVPISLTDTEDISRSQFYYMLKRYKAPWLGSPARDRLQLRMAAMIVRFLRTHSGCIATTGGGDWDVMTTVPSSRSTPPHPLQAVMQVSRTLSSAHIDLLERGPGPMDFNIASDNGFVVHQGVDVSGRRVLLVDDTYTTGARSQSAASALQQAGAVIVGILVVGRLVHQSYSPLLWAKATKSPFSFDTCCLHP